MSKFNYQDTDTVKRKTDEPMSREVRYEINKAIARLSLVCQKYNDCVDGCPFVEFTQNGIPHCKLDCRPENWELIK